MAKVGRVLAGIIVAIALLIGGVVLWYKTSYPTYTYRYRMTVEVPVDGKVHSGSSVIEIRLVSQPQLLPEMGPVRQEISGQAVYVDLGQGRNVFALLAAGPYARVYDYPAYVVPAHFDLSYQWRDLIKFPFLSGHWEIDPAVEPPDERPIFVTFSNLSDPKTVRLIQPDRFSEVFGPGVEPPTIIFEMTDAPVTRGIFRELPWLRDLRAVHIEDVQFPPGWDGSEISLTGNLFVRGL